MRCVFDLINGFFQNYTRRKKKQSPILGYNLLMIDEREIIVTMQHNWHYYLFTTFEYIYMRHKEGNSFQDGSDER